MNRFNFIFSVTSQLAKLFDEKQLEKNVQMCSLHDYNIKGLIP